MEMARFWGRCNLLESEEAVRMKSIMAVRDGALRHLAQLDDDIYGQRRKAARFVL